MNATCSGVPTVPRTGLSEGFCTKVVAPARNEADLDDIPEHLRRGMAFVWVSEIGEVFDAALAG